MKFIVIDNYDSFTYNLTQMFLKYGINPKVYRHDSISIEHFINEEPDYILLSPGPKNPEHVGISNKLIDTFHKKIPILGICLGMQCISNFFGGKTVRSKEPKHGRKDFIYHNKNGLFKKMPSPFTAARYNSLITEGFNFFNNSSISTDAWSENGSVMGISHSIFPIYGLQFHPESFLTNYGFKIIENFILSKNNTFL